MSEIRDAATSKEVMLANTTRLDDSPPALPSRRLRLVAGAAGVRGADPREAVRALYVEHYRDVARLAYLLVGGDAHLAEDVAHEAFARLYAKWDRVEHPDRALAYVRATVTNLAYSAHRRERTRQRHPVVPLTVLGDVHAASAEEHAIGHHERGDIVAALSALPERQRAAVVLRHWLRMTEGEIAEALGCSVGSVRTHLARGHAALAARLGTHKPVEGD